jgi:hypothetical protein
MIMTATQADKLGAEEAMAQNAACRSVSASIEIAFDPDSMRNAQNEFD